MIKIHRTFVGIFLSGLLLIPAFVGADPGAGAIENPKETKIEVRLTNPLDCGDDCTIMTLITMILNNVVMPIAAVAVVLWIIWAGFSFVTAQGNPKKIEEAKQRLLWSLVGAGILLGAAAISEVVQRTVDSLTN